MEINKLITLEEKKKFIITEVYPILVYNSLKKENLFESIDIFMENDKLIKNIVHEFRIKKKLLEKERNEKINLLNDKIKNIKNNEKLPRSEKKDLIKKIKIQKNNIENNFKKKSNSLDDESDETVENVVDVYEEIKEKRLKMIQREKMLGKSNISKENKFIKLGVLVLIALTSAFWINWRDKHCYKLSGNDKINCQIAGCDKIILDLKRKRIDAAHSKNPKKSRKILEREIKKWEERKDKYIKRINQ
jgi:hypothetical protein